MSSDTELWRPDGAITKTGTWEHCIASIEPDPEEMGMVRCPLCCHWTDPLMCWCGDFMKDHKAFGVCPGVPMGCHCGYPDGRKPNRMGQC